MFHRVVWQHIQGAMGFFDIRLTTNFSTNLLVNFFLNRLRFDRIRAMSLWLHCRPIRFVVCRPSSVRYNRPIWRSLSRGSGGDARLAYYEQFILGSFYT